MNEMTERVALAMAQALLPYQETYAVGDFENLVFSYVDVQNLDMRELAELAIEAMRGVSPEMLTEARRYLLPGNSDTNIEMAYEGMLDAALSS